jgi:methylenetetrahydrofolate--tRNA-(uracil-5-)-methyltransferase
VTAQPPESSKTIHIVGGGLAGCEAAWQVLQAGFKVVLHEMRPTKMTAAHQTGDLAELVCSNSLKSLSPASAPGRLKAEMAAFGSLIIRAAEKAKVPAGQALAVDRGVFSGFISTALSSHPAFSRESCEVVKIPSSAELAQSGECWIIATGPLTTPAMTTQLEALSDGSRRLFFYDAVAPIIDTDSIDMDIAFKASRYGKNAAASAAAKGEGASTVEEDGDYLNLPLSREEYEAFIDALIKAEYMPLHDFEDTKYFESCLPIEVMVERGRETLRFGPMKPVGLTDPRTGRWPWACVQLRRENVEGTMFSMVGFQTKMKWPEQKRVFSMIPGLAKADFLRFGSVHRNTYLKSPDVLNSDLSFKKSPQVFLAGQLTGVEGYTESASMGLLAGRCAVAKLSKTTFAMPPPSTVIGALANYVTRGGLGEFQPMNANLGLLPAVQRARGESKADKKARQCEAAKLAFASYVDTLVTQNLASQTSNQHH